MPQASLPSAPAFPTHGRSTATPAPHRQSWIALERIGPTNAMFRHVWKDWPDGGALPTQPSMPPTPSVGPTLPRRTKGHPTLSPRSIRVPQAGSPRPATPPPPTTHGPVQAQFARGHPTSNMPPTPRWRHTTRPSTHVSMWTTLRWARHSKAKTPANSRVALAQSCSIPWVLVRTNFGLIVRGLAAAWHRPMQSTKARGSDPLRRQNSVVLWVQQSFRP